METTMTLQCPNEGCRGEINIDPKALLMGARFTCPVCGSVIGMSKDSNKVPQKALDKLRELKNNLPK